jgi:hypothetical protein
MSASPDGGQKGTELKNHKGETNPKIEAKIPERFKYCKEKK